MQKLVCELCRSNNFTKDNEGYFVCDYCRTKYTPSQAQSLMVEGTVRVDRSGEAGNLVAMSSSAAASGNFQESYDYANRVLEIDPQNGLAWYLKASAAGALATQEQPRTTEILYAFARSREYSLEADGPETTSRVIENTLALGSSALSAGDASRALEYAESILEFDPDNVDAWFLKGTAFGRNQGEPRQALASAKSAFERAIECAPDEDKPSLRARCAAHLEVAAVEVEQRSWKQAQAEKSWDRHEAVSHEALDALATSYLWDPRRNPLDHYVAIASKHITGISVSYSAGTKTRMYRASLPQDIRVHARQQITWAGEQIRRFDPQYVTKFPKV